MENLNSIESAELGITYLKQIVNKIPGFKINKIATKEFSTWDASVTINNILDKSNNIVEIKTRYYSSHYTNEWYMEEHKYQDLKKVQTELLKTKNIKTRILYICFFMSNSKYHIYDVTNLPKELLTTRDLKTTTNGYGGQRPKKAPVYLLPNELIIYKGKF